MKNSFKKSCGIFIVFALLALILLGPEFFRPEELFFQGVRDPNPWFISYPWRNLVRLIFSAGEFPLWNPYNILGEPFLANYQQAIFSPFRWLFYFLPFPLGTSSVILLLLAFSGFGGWLFAKQLKLGDFSAFVCGAGYLLSGYLVQYLNNQHLPIDMLLPYGLLMMARLIEKQSVRNFLLLALIFILVLLGGQPESALFNLGFIFLYFLFRCWEEKKFFKPALVLLCISGFAMLFSLIQLLPFLEAIPQSWTFHPPKTASQHLELKTIASLLSPGLFGPTNLSPMPIQQIFPWLGTAIVFLSLGAIFNILRLKSHAQKGIALFFSSFALFALGIAYGIPGFNLITQVPGLDRLVWLKYLQPGISFSLIMLAGIGLEQILKSAESQPRVFPPLFLSFLVLVSGFVYSFFSFPKLRLWSVPSFLFSFSLLVLSGLIIKRKKVWIFILPILLEPMLYHHFLDQPSFWINMEKVDLSRFKRLQEEYPEARFSAEPEVWIPNLMQAVPIYDLGLNDALIPKRFVQLTKFLNQQESDEELLEEYLAYHSLRLKESAFNFPVAKILGAKFFIRKSAPKKFEAWEQEPGFWIPGKDGLRSHYTHTALYGDPIYVIPIPGSVPRVFFPKKLLRSKDAQSSYEKTLELRNFEEEAVVESAFGLLPERVSQPERADWEIEFSRITLRYESSEDAFAVFSEQYFPGWRAFLFTGKSAYSPARVRTPKKELQIYQTNYLLRGVLLPAGAHRLELVYQPWGFRVGLWVCLGCWLAEIIFIGCWGFLCVQPPKAPGRSTF